MNKTAITANMNHEEATYRLKMKGVTATSNRILVLKELAKAQFPMSLSALESKMPNMDKSSIFRVLTLFLEHDVVHSFEYGRGILEDIQIPHFALPDGFIPTSTSFVIKGECPECGKKHR